MSGIQKYPDLFSKYKLGDLELRNRIIMAPLTRQRADKKTGIPNELHVEYYAQRAQAGLIITECSQVADYATAFPGSCGIHSDEQVEGWKKVTQAVHDKGGLIFLQIWHGGRVCHPADHNRRQDLGPSPLAIRSTSHTNVGRLQHEAPKEMTEEDIQEVIQQFRKGAENAFKAGFDGIELYAANGYIVDSFVRDWANRRKDQWGGSAENRGRLCLAIIDQLVEVFGPGRVGVRFSPVGRTNDMYDNDPVSTYTYLVQELDKRNIAYIHFVEPNEKFDHNLNTLYFKKMEDQIPSCIDAFRKIFRNAFIDNVEYHAQNSQDAIVSGRTDLVAIGRPYISNPDLVERYANEWPLTKPLLEYSYTPGPRGYTDYLSYEQEQKILEAKQQQS